MRGTSTGYLVLLAVAGLIFFGCGAKKEEKSPLAELKKKVMGNQDFAFVKEKAREVVSAGLNAGDGYGEVWIRDFNTFIELACEVMPHEQLEDNLLVFFRMQGDDGNIIDGFIPREKAQAGYDYIYSDLEPRYAGHKNTVETDQESSLVQAVYKFVRKTQDRSILQKEVAGIKVRDRLDRAMDFLMNHRYDERYGLIWGATTVDWGDVQPEHEWGVFITDDTHYAIDIYDNAMFLIALQNLVDMEPSFRKKWLPVHDSIAARARRHLWDEKHQKFIPHIYLDVSPFPPDFDENQIYYHGGTIVAIEAGLLSKEEVIAALDRMVHNVKAAGAASIGLTVYPPYPEGFFKNKGMGPYSYQNGGDWTWFGARMIPQLIWYGFPEEAYEQLLPMTERVVKNDGFYEWYTIDNQPKGSGTFRGSAGVLYKAITLLELWVSV